MALIINVTGLNATGLVGNVLIWGIISNNQNPSWADLNNTQSTNWTSVNDSQTTTWIPVDIS